MASAAFLGQLEALEREVLALEPSFRRRFLALRQELDQQSRLTARTSANLERHQKLLDHSIRLAALNGAGLIASEVLDILIGLAGAERGFVGLVQPDGGWRLLVARSMSARDLTNPEAQVSASIAEQALASRMPVLIADASSESWHGHASVRRLGLRSVACLPIVRDGRALGFVYVDDPSAAALFDEDTVAALERWFPVVAEHLSRALAQADEVDPFPGFVTRSAHLQAELQQLARLARFDVSVLITGPTGTGKSMLASALHQRSHRAKGPLVHVNCSAVPESLLEGELFGAEAGAYTGARGRRVGKFEAANGGTLFLDEIDTMPIAGQVKLLVALQERKVTRLGSNTPFDLDVRVVAATNAEPRRAITEGRLREDLYFRLAKIEVHIPPLSERPEDVPLLARHILARTCERYGLPSVRLGSDALDKLCAYRWPGNVRELENVLDRAALLAADAGIIDDVRLDGGERRSTSGEARRMTVGRDEFVRAWQEAAGDAGEAARLLSVSRRSVFRLKKKLLGDDEETA
jgi:DNA-binding NtrC family response regulator